MAKIEYYISKIFKKMQLRAIKDSKINKTSRVGAGSLIIASQMDKNSFCGYNCTIVEAYIGSFCSIANNCEIGGASHSIDWISTSPVFNENKDQIKMKYSYHKFEVSKKTFIGNDVWIGANCLIKSGISIGNGAVIGMGSVVTKDVPPYEIWAGNPAKLIRKRFNDETIAALSEIQWWNFDDEILKKYAEYAPDVKKFIEEIYSNKNAKV